MTLQDIIEETTGITQEVAKLMYEGYHWDFIEEKVGRNVDGILETITRNIDRGIPHWA